MIYDAREAHNFLFATTRRLVTDVTFREYLLAEGYGPDHWPDCVPKKIALKFFEEKAVDGEHLAAHLAIEAMKRVRQVELPETANEYLGELKKHLEMLTALGLIDAIQKQPLKWRSHVERLAQIKPKGLRRYDVNDEVILSMKRTSDKIQNGSALVIVPGWERLSRAVGGFNGGRVTFLVSESGVGKTNFAINFAYEYSRIAAVLYFNLEMITDDFNMRFVQRNTGLKSSDMLSGHWDLNRIADWIGQYRESHKKIHVVEGTTVSSFELEAEIKNQAKENNVKLVIVDYDQKIHTDSKDDEWRAMLKNVVALEALAKELDLHVIVIGQANEDGAIKSSKRAAQPLSNHLHLYREGNAFGITLKKARFGRWGEKVMLDYRPETSYMGEADDQCPPLTQTMPPLENHARSLLGFPTKART